MGRRKLSFGKGGEPVVALDCDIPYNDCPILHKVITSNEMHLIDLASVQSEIECTLTDVIERIACLSAEMNGTEIQPNIIRAVHYKGMRGDSDGPQTSCRPSLIVKANPEKPLTLIISQQNRSQQSQTPSSVGDSVLAPIARSKAPIQGSSGRRSSRSTENAPSSPDTGPGPSSYTIPNKFWELMEPYCAEITESNITYLEELLRSYQDMDSAYFELPPLCQNDVYKSEASSSPVAKRTRRDAQLTSPICDPAKQPTASRNCFNDKTRNHLAKCIELELRRPASDSSPIGKLSESLMSSCYRENIIFSFTDSCAQLANDTSHSTVNHKDNECEAEDSNNLQPQQREAFDAVSRLDLLPLDAENQHPTSFPVALSSSISSLITSRASQPLKNIAKQLHVNSSFRIEKKISQVMDELGLFPLNLVHSPHHLSLVENSKEIGQHSVNKISSSTEAYYANLLTSIPRNTDNSTLVHQRTTDDEFGESHSSLAPVLRLYGCSTACQSQTQSTIRPPSQRGRRGKGRTDGDDQHTLAKVQSTQLQPSDQDEQVASITSRNLDGPLVNGKGHLEVATIANITKRDRRAGRLRRLRRLKLTGAHNNRRRRNRGRFTRNHQNGYAKVTSELPKDPSSELPLINGNIVTDDETSRDTYPIFREEKESAHTIHYPLSQSPTPPSGSSLFERVRNRFSLSGTAPVRSPVTGDSTRRRRSSNTCDSISCTQSSPLRQSCHIPDSDDNKNDENMSSSMVNGRATDDDIPDDEGDEQVVAKMDVECNSDHLDDTVSSQIIGTESPCVGPSAPETNHSRWNDVKPVPANQFFPDCTIIDPSDRQPKGLLSSCSSPANVTSHLLSDCTSNPLEPSTSDYPMDEISLAILQRQQELRLVCAANHSVLRRLVQAARRDVQRQEIQRRLAIADADVIEAYNKLESYRPQRKPPLKRDRDAAHKALKERRKIIKELEAFDAKSP